MFSRTRLICVSMNFLCDNSADEFSSNIQRSISLRHLDFKTSVFHSAVSFASVEIVCYGESNFDVLELN